MNKIKENSLLGRLIKESRDKLVASFETEEGKSLAGEMFDDYVSSGGDLNPRDLKRIGEVVQRVCGEGDKKTGELLVKKKIDEVRYLLNPLPRRGGNPLNSETGAADDGCEEEQLLAENRQALKAAKLPSGPGFDEEIPSQSGIQLLSSSRLPRNNKKQA